MNKRQKKKQVKVALLNTFLGVATKKDRFILKTIGTNKKIIKVLKTNQMLLHLNSMFSKIAEIFGSVFKAISDAVVTFAKKLKVEVEEKMRCIMEVKEERNLTFEEATKVVFSGSGKGIDAS